MAGGCTAEKGRWAEGVQEDALLRRGAGLKGCWVWAWESIAELAMLILGWCVRGGEVRLSWPRTTYRAKAGPMGAGPGTPPLGDAGPNMDVTTAHRYGSVTRWRAHFQLGVALPAPAPCSPTRTSISCLCTTMPLSS